MSLKFELTDLYQIIINLLFNVNIFNQQLKEFGFLYISMTLHFHQTKIYIKWVNVHYIIPELWDGIGA
jgi:hypothetical protein